MIEAHGLTRVFAPQRSGGMKRAPVRALRGVDFTIPERGAVSFIGESAGSCAASSSLTAAS
jgi:ABC-type oligopeptide transport system ATPase subunit